MRAFDYPYDPVMLACDKCGRHGRYSKRRFLELVGRNTPSPDARFKIAGDCKHALQYGGDIQSQCGVGFPDLLKAKRDKTDDTI